MLKDKKDKQNSSSLDMKALLSTLWIFVSANYIFCDVLSNMESSVLRELLTGQVGGVHLTQGFLLIAGIMMEIPFLMIVMARVLKQRVNRWVNIMAGIVMVVYQLSTMFVGTPPTLHYLFFSIIEVLGALIIVWLSWKWTNE